jgi:hypothetical protein
MVFASILIAKVFVSTEDSVQFWAYDYHDGDNRRWPHVYRSGVISCVAGWLFCVYTCKSTAPHDMGLVAGRNL